MLRIMRLLFIPILYVFCVSLLSCCSIGKSGAGKIFNDTIVCKKKIQDGISHHYADEYFIINKGDTSAYSFTFRYNLTYPHDCSMEIVNWPHYKQYLIPRSTVISCYEPNYQDFLKEMELCLSVALNEKKTINLKAIVFRLVNCTDIAIKTSKLFYSTKERNINHQSILRALQKTTLKEDFNTILNKYNLHVVREHCYEEIYLLNKSDFKKSYNGKEVLPDTILDVNVCLDISPIG